MLLAGFVLASALLFVWPATDQPSHVGAILSLNGGDEYSRESLAVALAQKGYSHTLLFSQGNAPTPCPRVPGIDVVCFVADPDRTVGEVSFAAEYARSHHLTSLMLVPSRPQATRARLLMKRCYTGRITVVPATVKPSNLPYDVLYEWGALAKALFVDRNC